MSDVWRTLAEWDRLDVDVETFLCPQCGSRIKPPLQSRVGCLGIFDDDDLPTNPYHLLRHSYVCTQCKVCSPARLQKLSEDDARREWLEQWLPAWEAMGRAVAELRANRSKKGG